MHDAHPGVEQQLASFPSCHKFSRLAATISGVQGNSLHGHTSPGLSLCALQHQSDEAGKVAACLKCRMRTWMQHQPHQPCKYTTGTAGILAGLGGAHTKQKMWMQGYESAVEPAVAGLMTWGHGSCCLSGGPSRVNESLWARERLQFCTARSFACLAMRLQSGSIFLRPLPKMG